MSHNSHNAILANFHTHTYRCQHAVGTDREYVEQAIKAGIKYLGFSDHTPYPTGTSYVSGMRMPLSAADDYFHSISSLKKEYANDINIYIGVEAEYFPHHYHKLKDFMKDYPLEYMILGNHFVPDEENGIYLGYSFMQKKYLDMYTENVIKAMNTGDFLYVAHPDLPDFRGINAKKHLSDSMDAICKEAKRLDIPLEINVLGYRRNGNYPSEILYKKAAKYQNKLIIGLDIHNPVDFADVTPALECIDNAISYGNEVYSDLNLLAHLDEK